MGDDGGGAQVGDDAPHVEVGHLVEVGRRHPHHPGAVAPDAVPDEAGQLGVAIAGDGLRDVGGDQSDLPGLVDEDLPLQLGGVAAVAAMKPRLSLPLGQARRVGGDGDAGEGDVVALLQHVVDPPVDPAQPPEPGERARANDARQACPRTRHVA